MRSGAFTSILRQNRGSLGYSSPSAVHVHRVAVGVRRRSFSTTSTFGRSTRPPTASTRFYRRPLSTTNQQKRAEESIPLWYPIVGGLVVTVAGGFKYAHDELGGTTGLKRAFSFYSLAIPSYLEYRYHMWKRSPQYVWDELDRKTSQKGLDKILELQAFYCKCGQMCASNIGNAFPPIWQSTMSVLQDEVPPQDFEVVRAIVNNEMPFDEVFSSFEETPIGSASIGQVHRAVLRKTGEKVVVKVRYPHVEKLLRGDVRTIKMFARMAQPVHVPALEEIEKQFQTEFDYVQEAEQLQTVYKNLTEAGLAGPGKACVVPKPFMEYCTTNILVMEELKGDKLAVALHKDIDRHAARQGQTAEEFMEAQKSKAHKYEEEQGERLQGPTKEDYDLYIATVDGQRRLANLWNRIYNLTAGWVATPRTYENKEVLPLNHAKLVNDLAYIHGHEILVNGYFNGDPHPGNILLCRGEDGAPQLGLIDYGQVKRLTKDQRHLFAKLVIALDEDNKDRIVELMKEAGFRSKNMNPDVIYLYAKVGYDEDNRKFTKGMHIQLFMEDLESRDPIIQLPQDFIMSRSMAHSWRPIAEEVLKKDI